MLHVRQRALEERASCWRRRHELGDGFRADELQRERRRRAEVDTTTSRLLLYHHFREPDKIGQNRTESDKIEDNPVLRSKSGFGPVDNPVLRSKYRIVFD